MAKREDKAREDRIIMEIVVDAYGREERAMGWWCYLDSILRFPFTAHCTGPRSISPLKRGDEVEVVGMAPADECRQEIFVTIRWERREGLGVPLAQLNPGAGADAATRQAVEDWLYWIKMSYAF